MAAAEVGPSKGSKSMNSSDDHSQEYTIRRLRAEDADGVSECVHRVWGEHYLHEELYHPAQIVRMNQAGTLISVVAVDPTGRVVGHYALERPGGGAIAETGVGLVLAEHRAHHLMHRMREALEDEARRLGLVGLFGTPVTNHLASQRVYEHFHCHPCGILLGRAPADHVSPGEIVNQRLSLVLYFKYLQPPPPAVAYAPAVHHAVLERIYEKLGVSVEFREGGPAGGAGRVSVLRDDRSHAVTLRVEHAGADTAREVRRLRQQCDTTGADVVYLQLPLGQSATPILATAAEADGFFFGGLGPAFATDGDVLWLQRLSTPLDVSRLQIENPFARDLVEYTVTDRQRVEGTNGVAE